MAIDVVVGGGVGELIINAPPVNALTNAGWREFATKMEALDGLPQRMIHNALSRRLERASGLEKLVMAIQNALALRRETGATIPDLLRSALAMRRNQKLSNAQMILAANAPILARIAMNDGDPDRGYLPSGSVAGVIDDRPSCEELVRRIVSEAEATLARLCR